MNLIMPNGKSVQVPTTGIKTFRVPEAFKRAQQASAKRRLNRALGIFQ